MISIPQKYRNTLLELKGRHDTIHLHNLSCRKFVRSKRNILINIYIKSWIMLFFEILMLFLYKLVFQVSIKSYRNYLLFKIDMYRILHMKKYRIRVDEFLELSLSFNSDENSFCISLLVNDLTSILEGKVERFYKCRCFAILTIQ